VLSYGAAADTAGVMTPRNAPGDQYNTRRETRFSDQ